MQVFSQHLDWSSLQHPSKVGQYRSLIADEGLGERVVSPLSLLPKAKWDESLRCAAPTVFPELHLRREGTEWQGSVLPPSPGLDV